MGKGEFWHFSIAMRVTVVYMNSNLIEKCERCQKQITCDQMIA